MGYPDSTVARWISLDAHTSLIVFVSLVALITVAIVSLFVYRCHVLIPQHHFLKINEKGHIYFSTALLFIYYFPVGAGLVNISPDQAEARQWVLEEYSRAKSVIDAPNLQVYTPYTIRRLVVTAVVLGSLAAAVLLQAISLSHHFLTKPNKVQLTVVVGDWMIATRVLREHGRWQTQSNRER
ncbi:hypothetical protein NECAME_00811 [Necator americanus]|uniref:Uncharacterized protein n=1 Tax=Necator americanus TaxID=51031 RepID=W2SYK8_NECAM|nr:hypothetical protein NECAME_00811 [Necator americanus]ETN73722.1 hypothetical protein NECAME_00811 [Necator americanus]